MVLNSNNKQEGIPIGCVLPTFLILAVGGWADPGYRPPNVDPPMQGVYPPFSVGRPNLCRQTPLEPDPSLYADSPGGRPPCRRTPYTE